MELFYSVFIKVKSFEMEKKHKKKKEGVVFECLNRRRRHHSRHRARCSLYYFLCTSFWPLKQLFTQKNKNDILKIAFVLKYKRGAKLPLIEYKTRAKRGKVFSRLHRRLCVIGFCGGVRRRRGMCVHSLLHFCVCVLMAQIAQFSAARAPANVWGSSI